jgi:NAD(P)-dependent dehydrogenase (short-subunit alcohol dehydrogenase family)
MSSPQPSDVTPIEDWNRLLTGKVAVVTGGGDGIGGAVSRLFAEHGALVEIAEIDPERAERKRAEIDAAGGTVRAHVVDVTKQPDVERLAEAVLSTHGRVDVLINNVGDYRPLVRFQDSTPESWDAMYSINLQHFFSVTHAFIGSMIKNHHGTIVNVHSVEGMRGYPGEPVYGAMKAAVAHFTTNLAVLMGRHGIRVNAIGPDLTQTPQVDYLTGFEDAEHLWTSWAPVGRLGWPEDQARVALFLASDMSGYVTGHNIPVDGGSKAGGGWFYSPTARRFVNRPKTL